MADFNAAEARWMARALRLASRGFYTARPNPRVGCVVVREDEVVGEGWHRRAGEAHAEILALEAAGDKARGGTAFVTLEPCSHHGQTPPCADALIRAGITAVVAAMEDPNPAVGGSGLDRLRRAGVEVRTGLMRHEAERLNEGFISRMSRGRPFVRVKIASSLDGATAMLDGESRWITGDDARRDVHRLRAASGAILTGAGTVAADDPSLTVRDVGDLGDEPPLRVVMDSRLRMPAEARMLGLPGQTRVFCIDDTGRGRIEAAGASVTRTREKSGRVDPSAVLEALAESAINDVLLEAGPALCGAFIDAGLADELVIYQAPHIMGSETRRMVDTPAWKALDQRFELDIVDVRSLGRDIRITARPTT